MSLFLFIALVSAAPLADLAAIDLRVAAFTGAGIGEEGGARTPVDRRLRLAACRAPLALSWRTEARDSVLVQCPDAGGWRLFVPVVQSAQASALPDAVHVGDSVAIAVKGQGFTVSQPGEAMESGAVGEWIRVRPATADRRKREDLRARILRPGVVMLDLP